MRSLCNWLVIGSLVGVSAIAAADPPWERGEGERRVEGPREAPPPARMERFEARAGYTWVPGRWDWRGRWVWSPGHHEPIVAGKKWREGRWERRGDVYAYVDGGWIDVDVRPTMAPPELREEPIPGPRPGMVWLRGSWQWRDGAYLWLPGRWEKRHPGRHWREPHWEMRDGVYVRVEGEWIEPSPYPTSAPPPLREESFVARPGWIHLKGHWDWREGEWTWVPGRWEKEVVGQVYEEDRWENRDTDGDGNPDRWVRVEGGWRRPPQATVTGTVTVQGTRPGVMVGPPVRTTIVVPHAPPAPRVEVIPAAREGHVWAKGHYQWNGNAYVWTPGHWEAVQANLTWTDGHWENQGNGYVWVEGGWR